MQEDTRLLALGDDAVRFGGVACLKRSEQGSGGRWKGATHLLERGALREKYTQESTESRDAAPSPEECTPAGTYFRDQLQRNHRSELGSHAHKLSQKPNPTERRERTR